MKSNPHLCDDGEGLEPGHPVQEAGPARHLGRVLCILRRAQRQLQVLQPAIHLASPSVESGNVMNFWPDSECSQTKLS